MNVSVREHRALNDEFFGMAKLPKRRCISCLAENWLASQGGLCSMQEASM